MATSNLIRRASPPPSTPPATDMSSLASAAAAAAARDAGWWRDRAARGMQSRGGCATHVVATAKGLELG